MNEATTYYVAIIQRVLEKKGYSWKVVHKLKEIINPQVIVTLTERYFLMAKIRYPKVKTIYWSQGVSAEEAKIYVNNWLSGLRYLFRRTVEPMAIKKSSILLCVSRRMVEYYKETYGLKDRGQIVIIPCYNLPLGSMEDMDRYKTPTFVYAGNASTWQCVDEMLDVYSIIEKNLPNASLYIYSSDMEEFTRKIHERGIKNYQIKYVKVDVLQKEMKSYKYGFVIRDNHIINQVATPTKLNSYLSSFLVPIFSDGVAAFAENINLGQFTIMAHCPLNTTDIANKIIEFERTVRDFSTYEKVVNEVFLNYYNDTIYEQRLNKMI